MGKCGWTLPAFWLLLQLSVMGPRVCVVGAGVSGVSTAVCIQEAAPHVQVTLLSDAFGSGVTSYGPPGLCRYWAHPRWGPGNSYDFLLKWGKETQEHHLSLLKSGEAALAGIQEISGYYISKQPLEEPKLKNYIPNYRKLSKEEVNNICQGYNYGQFYTTMMCECKWYLPWLIEKFKTNGGKLTNHHLNSIEELATGEYDVVVNCTGLGAAKLVHDPEIKPVKGQLVKIKAPWIKHCTYVLDVDDSPFATYIIPGREHVILGGYYKEGDWNDQAEDHITEKIMKRCTKLVPGLKYCKPDVIWAGLRPFRKFLRIEKEVMQFDAGNKTLKVVHNYGHGGIGIQLHWGCSLQAASLVKECLSGDVGTMAIRKQSSL